MKPNLTNHYTAPFTLHTCMPTLGIGKVIKSDTEGIKEGDLVTGFL